MASHVLLVFALVVAFCGMAYAVRHDILQCMTHDGPPPDARVAQLQTAMMESRNDACRSMAKSFSCGALYAQSLGMHDSSYVCMFLCAPHFADCGDVEIFKTYACQPSSNVEACYKTLNAFVASAFEF